MQNQVMFIDPRKAILSLFIGFGLNLVTVNFAFSEVASSDESAGTVYRNYAIPMDEENLRLRSDISFDRSGSFRTSSIPTPRQAAIAERMFPLNTVDGRSNLIQLYPNRAGFCGSYIYSSDPASDESFAHPMTACLVARVAQEWRRFCPRNSPCRLEMGDISHHTNPIFDGHSSHTDGFCIDLRPIKNEGEGDRAFGHPDYTGALTHTDTNYDQVKTRQLVELLTRLGGDTLDSSTKEPSPLLFNDPTLIEEGLTRTANGHDNHIHVCFRPENPTVQNSCAEYKPNERLCPRSEILLNHPSIYEMREALNDPTSQNI